MCDRLGNRLRLLRKQKLRQARTELADKLGVHVSTVKRWEDSISYPHGRHLRALAEALGEPAMDLVDTSSQPCRLCAKYGRETQRVGLDQELRVPTEPGNGGDS